VFQPLEAKRRACERQKGRRAFTFFFFLSISIFQSAIDPAFWARLGDHKLNLGLSEEPIAITGRFIHRW